jgi:hypothetical protein
MEFRVENIGLLNRALEKARCEVLSEEKDRLTFVDMHYNRISIDFNIGKMIAPMDGKLLSELCDSIKRSYSEIVVDEIARRNKWVKRRMGEGRYQLQRF